VIRFFSYRNLISPIKTLLLFVSQWLNQTKSIVLQKTNSEQPEESSANPDLQILNCRVRPMKEEKDDSVFDAFAVEICGSIHTSGHHKQSDTILKISIVDITDVSQQLSLQERLLTMLGRRTMTELQLMHDKAMPVYSNIKMWQAANSPVFCYNTELGKLPNDVTTLTDWTTVARLSLDWLTFPRKGKRNLQFNTSVVSRNSGEELACAQCTYDHENSEYGYIDSQKNTQRTKILTVALAFAVSAADEKLYNCEIELIKDWVRENIADAGASNKTKRNLDKALNKTISFFRNGNHLNTCKICKEIVEIAPVADRYDILELCLYVAQAKGFAAAEELALLKNLATLLEVDMDRFQEMTERILPINMHEARNMEVILGVTPEMNKEKTRRYLNKQFFKWNSRVINSDPAIQNQADQMLKLITEARSQYIG